MSTNMHSSKLLDGYQLSTTDGYTFNTVWVDLHSAKFFSITAMITGGTVAGTLTLQESNCDQSGDASGVFPKTAGSALGDAKDTVNVPSGTGQQSIVLTTSGVPGVINQYLVGYRWARLSCTLTTQNLTGSVDIFMHWKS